MREQDILECTLKVANELAGVPYNYLASIFKEHSSPLSDIRDFDIPLPTSSQVERALNFSTRNTYTTSTPNLSIFAPFVCVCMFFFFFSLSLHTIWNIIILSSDSVTELHTPHLQ